MADGIPERWRPVVGYEGIYEVSDHGRVRRVGGGVLIPSVLKRRERRVKLYRHGQRRGCYVHHLVLTAFVGPRPAGRETNHKDGDRGNNHLANLEWVTGSENVRHAYATGLVRAARGEKNGKAKLTDSQVAEIRRLAGTEPVAVTAARFGIGKRHVRSLRANKYRTPDTTPATTGAP